jgi:dipeptidyl aminopeptidase/acylaminoacyl peptidase
VLRRISCLALAIAAVLSSCTHRSRSVPAETAGPLIPRRVLFGNPERVGPQISPDGTQISYLAPLNGVMNVWVAPIGDLGTARSVTEDTGRGIRMHTWAYTSRHILYFQDEGGDENWRIYSVDVVTGARKTLTPEADVQAQIQELSPRFPEELLVRLNDRDPRFHDIHRVNLITGERSLVLENPGFPSFLTDDGFTVRFATRFTQEGGSEILRPEGDSWESFMTISPEDSLTTHPYGFDKHGTVLYMIDSRDRNTAAFTALDLATRKRTVLAADPRADVIDALVHPTEKTVEAVAVNYTRRRWTFLDDAVEAAMTRLRKVMPDAEVDVLDRSLDDRHWLVRYSSATQPARYYHYDRTTETPRYLFTDRPALEDLPLAPMYPAVVTARDGLELVCYVTVPVGTAGAEPLRPQEPLPLVLLVHGGPWARDRWGFHPYHQWLANRGYAVLSVNFRGSTGFGKAFLNASTRQWAGAMHDDLIDAVTWAVKTGIADQDRVAIMGGSYGGYAALVGLTFTPDIFACAVDIVGPSNLVTLLETVPPYWTPATRLFATRVGDHTTEEGRAFLESRSPLTRVDRITRPLLIAQGANDPRVKKSESDQIVAAMQAKGIPVTYVLYPDEGHGFRRPENSLSFSAVTEAFLAEHLGGRVEPIGGDFTGSSITVPVGADQIPHLAAALENRRE